MGEKVKNKNLKLKTGIKVKEADKITEEIDNKSSDKIRENKETCEFINDKKYSKYSKEMKQKCLKTSQILKN